MCPLVVGGDLESAACARRALLEDQRDLLAREPLHLVAEPGLLVGPQTIVTDLLQRPDFHRGGRAVAVDAAGRPVGLISIIDVQRHLRADALRPAAAAASVTRR